MTFIDSIETIIIFVIISIAATSVPSNDSRSLSPRNETKMIFGERILPSLRRSETYRQTNLPHFLSPSLNYRRRRQSLKEYYLPSLNYRRRRQSLKEHYLPAPLGEEKKRKLAQIMKNRYLEFRRKLEHSKEEVRDLPYQDRIPAKDVSFQTVSQQAPSKETPIYLPLLFESTKIPNKNTGTVAIQSSNFSPFSMAKKLRSADEAPSSSRSSGIRPGSLPFIPLTRPISTSGAQASQRASEIATQNVLDERLGPSARPTFDPSIVVDFYSLLQATRQSHGLTALKPHPGRSLRPNLDSHPEPQLLLQSESSEEVKVVRRKLKHEPLREEKFLFFDRASTRPQKSTRAQRVREEQRDLSSDRTSSEQIKDTRNDEQNQDEEEHLPSDGRSPSSSEQIRKRAQREELIADVKQEELLPSEERLPWDQTSDFHPANQEDEHLTSDQSSVHQPKSKRAQFLQLPSNVGQNSTMDVGDLSLYISTDNFAAAEDKPSAKKKEVSGEFGPHSDGNDPRAGVDPSNIDVPDLDLSTVHLPQGVRDSLRKYLKPLISTLKPLRKSVPGLPGLDYPILSVVPYTNFYCSNMPWPGFYADTEARCQTWHACDVDGRQSTFLCPNGTVFNQALMVCDWWYNTDCLTAPFLYPLNERLFGSQKPEPVAPYTRITPELLDTIFSP